jgi:hypothetical protein
MTSEAVSQEISKTAAEMCGTSVRRNQHECCQHFAACVSAKSATQIEQLVQGFNLYTENGISQKSLLMESSPL